MIRELRPILVLPLVLTGFAGAQSTENAVLAALASEMSDAFEPLVASALGVEDMSAETAFVAAADGLLVSAAALFDIAEDADALNQMGMPDAATAVQQQLFALAMALQNAADALNAADYSQAGESLDSFARGMDSLFSMDGQDGLPSVIKDGYGTALEGFHDVAAVYRMLGGSPNTLMGKGELFQYLLDEHTPGTDDLVTALMDPVDYVFPDFVPQEIRPTNPNFVGKWDEGTELRTYLEDDLTQEILDALDSLGGDAALTEDGPPGALDGLGEAAEEMSTSLNMLVLFLGLIEPGWTVDLGCTFECQTDEDCGDCYCDEIGFGTFLYDPSEIGDAKAVIGLLTKIGISRAGAPSPTASRGIRNAVKEAAQDIIDKIVASQGVMYGHFVRPICVFSVCWIIWEESDCSEEEEWVKIPLPKFQKLKPWNSWSNSQWDKALDNLQDELDDWCDESE